MSKQGLLLSFGRGGHSISFPSRKEGSLSYGPSTLTGYDSPDTFDGWNSVADGAIVIDKRCAVETDEGYRWVFNGPMCNVDLADGECDELPTDSLEGNPMVAAMVGDDGNQFGQLAVLQLVAKYRGVKRGPLDSVSVAEYAAGWADHGARIGVVRGRSIVWEGGAE